MAKKNIKAQLVKTAVKKVLESFNIYTLPKNIRSSGPQGDITIRIELDVCNSGRENAISYAFLTAFSERFKTTSIDVNDWSYQEGCPTCGDYSIECNLTIKGATV